MPGRTPIHSSAIAEYPVFTGLTETNLALPSVFSLPSAIFPSGIRTNALRPARAAYAAAEAEVLALEKQQADLTAALEGPEPYQNPSLALQLNRDLMSVQKSLAEATTRWEQLASSVGSTENTDH